MSHPPGTFEFIRWSYCTEFSRGCQQVTGPRGLCGGNTGMRYAKALMNLGVKEFPVAGMTAAATPRGAQHAYSRAPVESTFGGAAPHWKAQGAASSCCPAQGTRQRTFPTPWGVTGANEASTIPQGRTECVRGTYANWYPRPVVVVHCWIGTHALAPAQNARRIPTTVWSVTCRKSS